MTTFQANVRYNFIPIFEDATGNPIPTLNYEWRRNNSVISTNRDLTNVLINPTSEFRGNIPNIILLKNDVLNFNVTATQPQINNLFGSRSLSGTLTINLSPTSINPIGIRLITFPQSIISKINNPQVGNILFVASATNNQFTSPILNNAVIVNYEWKSGFNIVSSGPTTNTYTINQDDIDKLISCTISFKDITDPTNSPLQNISAFIECGNVPQEIDSDGDLVGWTTLTPSSDSRLIYVDAVNGNDAAASTIKGRGFYLPDDEEIGPDPTNPVGPIVAYKSLWRAETRLRRTTYLSQNGSTDVYGSWDRWDQLVAIGQSHRGFPDWLLLRRGDSFVYDTEGRGGCEDFPYAPSACSSSPSWQGGQTGGLLRGRSETEPMVITAWGNPSSSRPIRTSGMGISGACTNLRIVSIDFLGSLTWGRSNDGFHAEDILVEDCRMRSAGSTDIGAFKNCRLRRCTISGSFNSSAHNQGMYISNRVGAGPGTPYPIDSWIIEECVFDRNGYKEDPNDATTWTGSVVVPESGAGLPAGTGVQPRRTFYDRNIYVASGDGTNHVQLALRGNIFSRDGGGGSVQMRQGGVSERNLFLWNEDAGFNASGAGGIYKDNLVLHDDHLLPPGGWGKALGVWNFDSSGLDLFYVMDGNVAAHFHRGTNGPSGFHTGDIQPSGMSANVRIVNNAAYLPSSQGLSISNNKTQTITVSGNEIAAGTVVGGQLASSSGTPYQIDGNQYHSTASTPFNGTLTFQEWKAIRPDLDDSSTFDADFAAFKTAVGWTAPERDIVSYMQSVDATYVADEEVYVDADATGPKQATRQKVWEVLRNHSAWPGAMTESQAKLTARRYHAFITFIQRAKANRKGAWDPKYTAEAVNNYIRQGFGRPLVSGPYTVTLASLGAYS